jgi:hypothetical protein
VQSQVSQYATIPNLALYTSYGQLHTVSGYALDSQVSAFVIAQDQIVHGQVTSYIQSQVSAYPYNASVSAWIVDVKASVNAQVTSYVQSQVSAYPYASQVTSWIASGTSPFASVTSWVVNAVSAFPTPSGNNAWTGNNEFALAESGVSLVTVYTSRTLTAKEAASTFVIVRTAIGGTPPTIQISGSTPFISVFDRYGSGATLWVSGTLLYDSGSQFKSGSTFFWNSGVTGFQAQFAYIGSSEYVVTHNAPSNGTLSGGTPFFK